MKPDLIKKNAYFIHAMVLVFLVGELMLFVLMKLSVRLY